MNETRAEAHIATDPVCGMMVDPHAGKPTEQFGGHDLLFLLGGLPQQIRQGPRALSRQQGRAGAAAGRHALHLPDASADRAGGSGPLPDLRHGARADGRAARGHRQSRADRLHPPALGGGAACARAARPRHGRPCLRRRSPAVPFARSPAMAEARPRHTGRAVVRLAVLRARVRSRSAPAGSTCSP